MKLEINKILMIFFYTFSYLLCQSNEEEEGFDLIIGL